MSKGVKIGLAVVGGIIVISAIAASSGNKSNTQSVPNSNSDTTNTAPAQQSEAQKEKLTIKNSTYSEANGLKQVVGEVTNNDTGVHSATLKATFYDASGKILGTASGAVNEVAAGETKTFTLITADNVTGYKDMEVQVDTLL